MIGQKYRQIWGIAGNLLWLTLLLAYTVSAAEVCPENRSSVECIQERDRIVVGVKADARPFGFHDHDGNFMGFEIDLAKAFAKCWLGDENKVTFVPVTSASRAAALQKREVDFIAATMTHTRQREEALDFSQPYFEDGQRLLVREDSELGKAIDVDVSFESYAKLLHNTTIAVIEGSTSEETIRRQADKSGITLDFRRFRTYFDAIQALKNRDVDIVTSDGGILAGFAQRALELKVVGAPFSAEPYAIGIYKGDSKLRRLIDTTLQALMASGEYEKIFRKWFPAWPLYKIEVLPGEFDFSPFEGCKLFSPKLAISRVCAEGQSMVACIRARGFIIAGVRYDAKPFGYWNDSQEQLEGFEIDLIKTFARYWLNDEQAIKFIQVTSDDRIRLLQERKIDLIAAAMTHTIDRDQAIDFSQTYFQDGQRLLVRKDLNITSIKNLEGKTVGVVGGTTAAENLRQKMEEDKRKPLIQEFRTYYDAVNALQAQHIDAVVADGVILAGLAQKNPELDVTGPALSLEPYAIGVYQGDSQFRDLINATLQVMIATGEYETLYAKWFPGASIYAIQVLPGNHDIQQLRLIGGESE